jgi:IMP cyclohydrolase
MNEMKLKENVYPGRGIIIGMTPDERNIAQIYWIMGRSENSRNRVFVTEGGSVKTKAYEESKMTDPSLIIYYPSRTVNNVHIITNGDQTDTIYNYLEEKKSFEEALLTRSYEPDPPNFTPRISGAVFYRGEESNFVLSVLRTVNNDGNIEKKEFYTYNSFTPGEGRCIHTYMGDGNPLPSFDTAPYAVGLKNSLEENLKKYWEYLNEENRVAILCKFIDVKTGAAEIGIINRFGE